MEENRTSIASDLKSLERAVPRQRLIVYAAALALIPAALVWFALSDREGRPDPADAGPTGQEAQEEAGGQAEAPAPAPAPAPRPSGAAPSAPQGEWKTVVTPDGKYQFQIPPGTKVTQGEGYTYVVPESPAGALPHMAVKIATGVDKQVYKPNPGNSVMLDIGLNTYWLYTWQFKTWDPFARLVSTFKVL